MHSFDQAIQVIAGIMRNGVAKHPDNEWVRRSIEYHIGRAEEHLRLLQEGEQLEDHLAHAATRLRSGGRAWPFQPISLRVKAISRRVAA